MIQKSGKFDPKGVQNAEMIMKIEILFRGINGWKSRYLRQEWL